MFRRRFRILLLNVGRSESNKIPTTDTSGRLATAEIASSTEPDSSPVSITTRNFGLSASAVVIPPIRRFSTLPKESAHIIRDDDTGLLYGDSVHAHLSRRTTPCSRCYSPQDERQRAWGYLLRHREY